LTIQDEQTACYADDDDQLHPFFFIAATKNEKLSVAVERNAEGTKRVRVASAPENRSPVCVYVSQGPSEACGRQQTINAIVLVLFSDTNLKLARFPARGSAFYVADPLSSIQQFTLMIKQVASLCVTVGSGPVCDE
jgi:hypothetical protein